MKKIKKPFFAKFLEKQLDETEKNSAKGGAEAVDDTTSRDKDVIVTMKWPSDADEDWDWDWPTRG